MKKILFISLIAFQSFMSADAVDWYSIDYPGPRGTNKYAQYVIAPAAVLLGIGGFACIAAKNKDVQTFFARAAKKIKKHPSYIIAGLLGAGLLAAGLKYRSMQPKSLIIE